MSTTDFSELRKLIVKNTPSIIKCARISNGLDQVSLAKSLGVSQSTISKYEKGHLIPDAINWAIICQVTSIPLDSNELGFLDFEQAASFNFRLKDEMENVHSMNWIHPIFRQDCGYNNRYLKPLIGHAFETKGEEACRQFFSDLNIDPSYFVRLDLQLNDTFLSKFGEFFGSLPKSEELSGEFWKLEHHGLACRRSLSQGQALQTYLESYIEKSMAYNCVFNYEVIEKKPQTSVFRFFSKESVECCEFAIDYHELFLKQLCLHDQRNLQIDKSGSEWLAIVS
jgi:transcriptional regulator with XRE-family HTH domain